MSSQAAPEIFDVHQHVGGLIGIAGVGETEADPHKDAAIRLDVMDRFGIARAALMPVHAYASARGLADTRAINDAILAVAGVAPERFPVLSGTVEPRHGARALEEVDRLHDAGFRALSWHHRMQGLPMDHATMFAIVERMSAYGMAVMAHCYAHADFEAPWRLRRLAERFPETAFIALDAMTSPENLEQILAATETAPNVNLDLTSTVLGAAGVRACVRRVGASRLLFGTNYYSMSPRRRLGELEEVDEAGLTAEERALILGGNARRLLRV